MSDDSLSHKPVAEPLARSLALALHLDPDRWEVTGLDVSGGDLGVFPEDGSEVLTFGTDTVRDIDTGTAVIHVTMRHGLRHTCPHCGQVAGIHDWVSTSYKSASILMMTTSVRISVPRLRCSGCDTIRKARCPLVEPGRTYTKVLKLHSLSLLSQETVTATAQGCRIGPWIAGNILESAVEEGTANQDLSGLTGLFIDEIQFGHGQDYITMVADQDHNAVCGVRGNDAEAVRRARDILVSKGCDPDRIEFVCSDMSTSYRSGVSECFPRAKRILDKFHIIKLVNESVDVTRKRCFRELKAAGLEYPKRVKYTVLYREANLPERHRSRLEQVRLLAPELAQAFDLKEEFIGMFDCRDRHEARSYFFSWYNRTRGSRIPEMVDVSNRLLRRLNDILRWFDRRVTNAVSEGLNNTYKKIKSAAFGFRNPDHLIGLCLFRKGNLTVSI